LRFKPLGILSRRPRRWAVLALSPRRNSDIQAPPIRPCLRVQNQAVPLLRRHSRVSRYHAWMIAPERYLFATTRVINKLKFGSSARRDCATELVPQLRPQPVIGLASATAVPHRAFVAPSQAVRDRITQRGASHVVLLDYHRCACRSGIRKRRRER